MKYIYIGKIVNTHGIKGEVRLLSNFKFKDKVFKKGMTIYIGKDKVIKPSSASAKNQIDIALSKVQLT